MALCLNVKLLTGELHSLTTSANKTVWDFKIQVESKTGVPPYQQKLAFQKDTPIDLQDGTQLSAYGLESGNTLLLIIKNEESISVFLKNDRGITNTYQVLPSDLVSQFRERVQRRENIHTDQFWLVYEGNPLENGCKLSDYKIAPNGTIFLNLRLRGGTA
ncbi:hypothetical protein JRQ81_007631 [Phrynocephalus forsythii]|uniref:Ubiquitin-like domain-containing protein n=1 Tax=Phrynocephalus forsythii TaxID=171643 RepID=A0A9Q0XC51_9SAUR|nr:hypothetical protein JRQ81_007631 [Phrynocephalus forsythii]